MLAFLTMERPESANLRPCRWAMVIACWMRWMCEAKLATITRPSASAKIRWKALLTVLSEAVEPGSLGVGRVAEQREDALLAEPGEGVHVGDAAVDRRVVEAVVAGEHDRAEVGAEHDRERVGDAVAGRDEGEVERADLQARLVADLDELDALEQAVLLELGLDEREREAAAVDGPVEPPQHERQRALMILVTVRDHEGEHVLLALHEPADVGENEVDAEHVLAGELDAAVEHHDLAAVLDRGHVLADLAEPPEGDDPYGVFTHGNAFSLCVRVAAGLRRRSDRVA